jgi:hypothetical protein
MREQHAVASPRPVELQIAWLKRGLTQAGGKLPLFDRYGQKVDGQTVAACIAKGWAEPWFDNPLKPDWMVCKLTARGRRVAVSGDERAAQGNQSRGDHQLPNAYFL